MAIYQEIGGGYAFAAMPRGGLMVRAPNGWEIFIQPGDDEAIMRDNIEALNEVSENVEDAKRGTIADMMLGEYFA